MTDVEKAAAIYDGLTPDVRTALKALAVSAVLETPKGRKMLKGILDQYDNGTLTQLTGVELTGGK